MADEVAIAHVPASGEGSPLAEGVRIAHVPFASILEDERLDLRERQIKWLDRMERMLAEYDAAFGVLAALREEDAINQLARMWTRDDKVQNTSKVKRAELRKLVGQIGFDAVAAILNRKPEQVVQMAWPTHYRNIPKVLAVSRRVLGLEEADFAAIAKELSGAGIGVRREFVWQICHKLHGVKSARRPGVGLNTRED